MNEQSGQTEQSDETTIVAQPDNGPMTLAKLGLWFVRYGIGLLMILGGVVVLLVAPSSSGVDGLAMLVGGGLAVLLLNFLFRLGVSGDEERERHEQAWKYFEEHGEWPDDPPAKRVWTVPAGSVVYKDEIVKPS
jgi:uncharacterized oligopeptide transporter (OPT) family protein